MLDHMMLHYNKRKTDKIRKKVDQAKSLYDQLTQELATKEEEIAQLGNIDDIMGKKVMLDEKLKANTLKLREYKVSYTVTHGLQVR